MKREKVYRRIDRERDYQDTKWPKPAHSHSTTEYLAYIHTYVLKGLNAVSTEDGEAGGLEVIRKIAGLAVACMEEHGAPKRNPFDAGKPPKKKTDDYFEALANCAEDECDCDCELCVTKLQTKKKKK